MPTHEHATTDALLIDVRSPQEWAQGHLEGAVLVPLDQLQPRIGRVAPDPDRTLIVYCASGARSAMACALLRQMGYQNLLNGGGLQPLARAMGQAIVCG